MAQEALDIENVCSLHEAIARAAEITGGVVTRAIYVAMNWKSDKVSKGKLPKIRSWPSRKEISEFKNWGYNFV